MRPPIPKKDLQIVAEEAKMSGTVILLLDEIHRLDKTKQDFLLPHLESGRIVLVGATTENPYMSILPAIRSRSQIFQVYPLTPADIATAIARALADKTRGLGNYPVALAPEAKTYLTTATNGDLRSALNALELAVLSTPEVDGEIAITAEVMHQSLQQRAIAGDPDGDAHYDVISAFQKSIRGSDVDAALHYLARLITVGDLPSILRRLLVIAYEDVAWPIRKPPPARLPRFKPPSASACPRAASRWPPPSSICVSRRKATPPSPPSMRRWPMSLPAKPAVPDDLRDAHYQGAKSLGHGVHYQLPHHFPNGWVKQQYLPDTLINAAYYTPKQTGKYEQALTAQWHQLRRWQGRE